MTCRHGPNDPSCSSHPSHPYNPASRRKADAAAKVREAEEKVQDLLARTPNPEIFEVIEVEEVQGHLVMMVRYSSCQKCSFDSKKVMVFENTSVKDAIKWRVIDPHFYEHNKQDKKYSPSPAARFPASEIGWARALLFAKTMLPPNPLKRYDSQNGT